MSKEFLNLLLPQGYTHQDFVYKNSNNRENDIEKFNENLKDLKTLIKENKVQDWIKADILHENALTINESLVRNNLAQKHKKLQVFKTKVLNKFNDFSNQTEQLELLVSTTSQIQSNKKLFNKVYNVYIKKHYNLTEVLTLDFNKFNNTLNIATKLHFTKIPIIERVCEILGVKNCTNDETIFNESNIQLYLQEIEFSYYD